MEPKLGVTECSESFESAVKLEIHRMMRAAQPDPYFFQPPWLVGKLVLAAEECAGWVLFEHLAIHERSPEDGTWLTGEFRYSVWLYDHVRVPRLVYEQPVHIQRPTESAPSTPCLVCPTIQQQVMAVLQRTIAAARIAKREDMSEPLHQPRPAAVPVCPALVLS